MKHVIGIDAGASKTVALVADLKGEVLARGTASGANPKAVGVTTAANQIKAAVKSAWAAGLADPSECRAIYAGVAGVATPAESIAMYRKLSQLAPKVAIGSDLLIALRSALPTGAGVLLLSGTGSAAFGIGPNQNTVQAGGWGQIVGDSGSGLALGRITLKAALAARDGVWPPGVAIAAGLLGRLNLSSWEELRNWLASSPEPAQIAALAPWLLDLAQAGDLGAVELANQEQEQLCRLSEAVVKQLELTGSFPLVLGGGVFQNPYWRQGVSARLQARFPAARLIWSQEEPAQGAVALALALI